MKRLLVWFVRKMIATKINSKTIIPEIITNKIPYKSGMILPKKPGNQSFQIKGVK
jgi:hypothetical protein